MYAAKDLAELLLVKKDTVAAEHVLLQQLPLHLQSPKMFYQLGNFYFQVGQHSEAIKQYEKCIAIDDSYLDALTSLAYLHLLNGNEKNSRRYIQQLMQLDNDPLKMIAYINAVVERSLAVPVATRLNWLSDFLILDPLNIALSEAMAATAYQNGAGYSKAFAQAVKAEQKSEYNNPVLIKWLFLLSIEMNNPSQIKLFAKQYLDKVLITEPAIEAMALKLSGNSAEAKIIKRQAAPAAINMYRNNFKKLFAGI